MTVEDPKTGLLYVFKHVSMHNPAISCPEATLKKILSCGMCMNITCKSKCWGNSKLTDR